MKTNNKNNLDNYIHLSQFFVEIGSPALSLRDLAKLIESQIDIEVYFEKQTVKYYLHQKDYANFFQMYHSINKVCMTTSLSKQTIRKTLKNNNIPLISFGKTFDQIFVPIKYIQKYIFNETYISVYQLLELIGVNKESSATWPASTYRAVIKNIEKDIELQELLGYTKLEFPIYFKGETMAQQKVLIKQNVKEFLNTHIPVSNYLVETSTQRSNFLTLLKSYKMPIYYFYSNHKYTYISKKDYNLLKEHRKTKNLLGSSLLLKSQKYKTYQSLETLITKSKLPKLLKLSEESLLIVTKEYNLQPDEIIISGKSTISFYEKLKIDDLINKQTTLLEEYSKNYISIGHLKKDLEFRDFIHLVYNGVYSKEIERVSVPTILRGLYNSSLYLYNLEDIKSYLNRYSENVAIQKTNLESPYPDFLYKTEGVLKVRFHSYINNTKELWYQFVKKDLINFAQEDFTSYTTVLSKITKNLAQCLEKEIYMYSSVSLNKLIFSQKSSFHIKHQVILYRFIQSIKQTIRQNNITTNYFGSLNNPKYYETNRIVDTSRYSYEEYMAIYKYSSNIKLHKTKAIKEIKGFLNGDKYSHYDSYWLYVLIHLTNSWRHSTIITEIPEIELPDSIVGTLVWMEDHEVSLEEAEAVIFQLGRMLIRINKTGAETEFRIADPLKIPFATAIIICQIRKNLYSLLISKNQNSYGPLIWLPRNRTIEKRHLPHKRFFEGFLPGFEFKNRKMNKTLMTLIWSATRSLDVAKTSRSHYSQDSTLTYIQLSDEELENLMFQLFERNTFGYLSKMLSEKIFDNNNVSKEIETERINSITEKFGDVHKMEITIGMVNHIAQQEDDIQRFLDGLSPEEAKRLFYNSLTNTLYTKKRFYQCALTNCKYENESSPSKDCANCHFSIVNVYAISNLMDLYLTKINKLINEFEESSVGEKKKMANQFFLLWKQIQEAKERFGEAIYSFVDGGKERFNILSKQLPFTKEYLTINTRE